MCLDKDSLSTLMEVCRMRNTLETIALLKTFYRQEIKNDKGFSADLKGGFLSAITFMVDYMKLMLEKAEQDGSYVDINDMDIAIKKEFGIDILEGEKVKKEEKVSSNKDFLEWFHKDEEDMEDMWDD